jgi:hypothetical protein
MQLSTVRQLERFRFGQAELMSFCRDTTTFGLEIKNFSTLNSRGVISTRYSRRHTLITGDTILIDGGWTAR